ncbi:hypothetical protein O1Q96_37590 [Streptomyces sp. Qhu-G9]|uniref:ApeA N-terminal domain 1-containing protein n=1 Tax=Streptomyces sp. Qhu-G9 TaxID=3452799 RepID=UPI0022ABFEBA|nr:HEPN domain-containing protein [Streptomyces aurantiacus]WAU84908.1 hypothetical protein O1Q96_37590 [Streptomyces aurantiacus]
MAELSWRGTWWSAEEPEVTCPGTLHCADGGYLRLELIGGFDVTVRTPLPSGNGYGISEDSRDFPIIHGTSGSTLFTLLGNHAIHTRGSGFLGGEITEQNWSSNRALRGVHLPSLEESLFIRSHMRLERLLHWSNRSSFDLSRLLEDGKATGERQVDTHAVEPVTAVHNGMNISLRLLTDDFNIQHKPISNERLLKATERAALTFSPPEPTPYNSFDKIHKDMQDLLTLCSYAPCGSHGRSLVYELPEATSNSSQRLKEVEVIGRQVYRTEKDKEESQSRDFLFTLAEVDFAELAPRWLALKEKSRMGCDILFGLRYISNGYVGTRLLGVASAAESIHASLRSASTPLPKAQYRSLKRKLLAAIADEPEDLQEFVKTGLRNNPTYNERMLELASIPDSEAVDLLLTDRKSWAKMLRNARNDLAHANERVSQNPESTPAYWLLETTYALLCLVLMTELGISREKQRAALDHPRIRMASRKFKRELSRHSSG